jgi:hypothetical protein
VGGGTADAAPWGNQQSAISNQQSTVDKQHSKSRELSPSVYAPRKPLPPHTTSFFCAAEAIGGVWMPVDKVTV